MCANGKKSASDWANERDDGSSQFQRDDGRDAMREDVHAWKIGNAKTEIGLKLHSSSCHKQSKVLKA